MVISSLKKYEGILYPSESGSAGNQTSAITGHSESSHATITPGDPANFLSDDPVRGKVLIGMALSFLSGIIQVIFSILHVGFVTKYLSDAIVNGFTCGAAYHVVVSQISTLLGIKLGDSHLAFVLVGVSPRGISYFNP